MRIRSLVVAVVLLSACGKKGEKEPSSGSGSDNPVAVKPADPKPADPPKAPEAPKLTVNVRGKELTIVSQYAHFWPWGVEVKLFSKPHTCSDPRNDEPDMVQFNVLSGPGGKYFVGQPQFARVFAHSESRDDLPAYASSVTVEPFEAKADAHIKGTIAVEWKKGDKLVKVSGPFDATICNNPDTSRKVLPESVDKPLAGTIGKKNVSAKTTIAELKRDEANGVDHVEKLYFFPKAMTCKDYFAKRGEAFLIARDFGAANSKQNAANTFQPVDFDSPGSGWVKFDALDLKDGGTITGSIAANYSDPGSDEKKHVDVAGTFSAMVCK